jgi:GntR family transcriptional regulator of vanillate catabolism
VNEQLTQVVVAIREMILRGELMAGQRVAEAPLAERLGVSRTPVRQALPLLAQEGLLMVHATRGFVVRAFTTADIIDAIDLRGLLEGYAVRRLAERGVSKSLLRELKSCLEDGDAILAKRYVVESDEGRYAEFNARFHGLLIEAADSALLSDAIVRNGRIPFAGAQAVAFDKTNLERMYDVFVYAHRQHYGIVDALETSQSARAEALIREHANTAKQSINVASFPLLSRDAVGRGLSL